MSKSTRAQKEMRQRLSDVLLAQKVVFDQGDVALMCVQSGDYDGHTPIFEVRVVLDKEDSKWCFAEGTFNEFQPLSDKGVEEWYRGADAENCIKELREINNVFLRFLELTEDTYACLEDHLYWVKSVSRQRCSLYPVGEYVATAEEALKQEPRMLTCAPKDLNAFCTTAHP